MLTDEPPFDKVRYWTVKPPLPNFATACTKQNRKRSPLFIFAATMMVYIGGSQLVQQIDRLMIGALLPSQELGIYDAAAILCAHITIFLTALNSIVAPKISAAFHSGKKEEVKALFRLETRWVWNLSIPLFLALIFLRNPLMHAFGQEFLLGGR